MGGRGLEFLDHSLKVLSGQNFQAFEVVVADQSKDNAIKKPLRQLLGAECQAYPYRPFKTAGVS